MQDVENVYQDAFYRTNWLKGLFIHDISNLFQIISNSIELCESLLIDKVKTGDIIDYFQMIAQQLNRGKKLIKSFRNLSELEEHELSLTSVEVLSMLRSAINSIRNSFPKKNIDIKIVSDDRSLYVMANELLREVFENIITNSINYNRKKLVQIEVMISIFNTHHVKIEFKDNGIGIVEKQAF
jgi:signal transduction histidine kinase